MAEPHQAHLGGAGPALTPEAQFIEFEAGSLRLHLHPSIREVANPAVQAQFSGSTAAGAAKAHALHRAFHQQAPALFQGLRLEFLAADEPTAVLVAAPSTAARHRHEIVEQPPQWRCTQLA